jgi:pilus assembly protein CpaE
MDSLPLLVFDPDQAIRSRLAMQLGEAALPVASVEELAPSFTGSPVVLVLGPTCSRSDDLGGAASLINGRPEVGAILVAAELSTDLLQSALRSGVRDVLAAPVDTNQLAEAVARVVDTIGGTLPAPIPVTEIPGGGAKIVTVFSTKGGAGKSMLAANLAVVLAKEAKARGEERPVVLVDADLQFGDITVMLHLTPQHTIVDAVSSIDRLDAPLLHSLLVKHEPSGLFVLPAPLEPAFADQIGAAEMSRILDLLRQSCSHVVIDTPAYFNEVVLALIDESDDVLLIAGMDIPNIKNVKIGLQTLRLLNTPMSKLHLVLNRANSKVKLDVSEVERTLQVKADALIPSDVVVPQSVNKGTPVVLDAPKSGVARSIEALAKMFIEDPQS